MSQEALSPETVLQLARLARLRLSEDELPRITADLQKILGHVRSLDEIDAAEMEGVEATAHVHLDRLPFRADAPKPSLSRDEILAQAPRRGDEGFSVPTFVEE
jgi:aspartyl-tRNA(Asn)/glutamyl-tRNA(Gln) amidotransferase subunit C